MLISLLHMRWRQFRRSRLVANTLALYASYLANYLVPLVTVPYTLRVLTPTGYGRGAFALSFAGLFGVLAGYGFNFTATRAVSTCSDDMRQVSRIASEVVCAELFLLGVCGLGFALAVLAVPPLRAEKSLMWIAFMIPTFTVLQPTWLYQGIEELRFSAKVSVFLKIAYVPALFLLVREPSDTGIWLMLRAASLGLGASYLWFHATRRLGVVWIRPKLSSVRLQLREGYAVFLSQSALTLYTIANTFIVGILTNTTIAGYYSAAEKLVRVALSAWQPLQQAIYPHVTRLAFESREAALGAVRKVLFLQGGMGATLSMGLYLAAPWVIPTLLGPKFLPSVTILRILSPLPILVSVSNVFGNQILLPFKKDKPFSLFLIFAGLLNVGLGALLVPHWQASGMAFSVTCTELLVTSGMLCYLIRLRLMPSLKFGFQSIRF